MPSVAACLRQHGDRVLDDDRIPGHVRNVLRAVIRCRTGELGSVVYDCRGCGRRHWVGRSCGNRHCPGCQHEKTQDWLRRQSDRLLPVPHFLVTFTVPREVSRVLRSQPKPFYDAIFAAAAAALRHRTARSKYLKDCEPGFFGVLHTWGRDPRVYHPHVHFVVPGGAPRKDGSRWEATPANFLFPHAALVQDYRRFFRTALEQAGLDQLVPPHVWEDDWVVDIRPVGDGQAVLKYLAPYVHRVAIGDNRILDCSEQTVTYRVTPSGSKTSTTRTVSGEQFVRGFAQHVLPKGFQKVRYYGWMAGSSRFRPEALRWLVWLHLGWTYWLGSGVAPQPELPATGPVCAHCGGELRLVMIIAADGRVLVNHAVEYLDSG